jgi:ABC-type multidrug transport system fused ATPase/permease subunit
MTRGVAPAAPPAGLPPLERSVYRYVARRSLHHQVALSALVLLSTAAGLAPLELQKRIVNLAIELRDLPALVAYSAGFLLAVLVAGLLKYLITNYEGMIAERVLRDFREELYERVLGAGPGPPARPSAAQLISMILAEAEELGQFFGQAFAVPLVSGLTLLAVTGYMAYLNPWMALFAVHPLQLWLIPRLQRRVNALSRERVTLGRQLSDHLQWSVGRGEAVPPDDRPAPALQRFREHADGIFRIRVRVYRIKYLIKWIGNFLAKLGPFFLFLVGGWLIIERPGSFDLGSLVAALAAYERLNEPWQELLDYYQEKEIAKVRYEQIIATCDASSPPGAAPAPAR